MPSKIPKIDELRHHNERAFEAFTGARTAKRILHLTVGGAMHGAPIQDDHVATMTGKLIEGLDSRSFECPMIDAVAIPRRDASIDFVFLRLRGKATRTISDAAALIREIGRVAAPDAELFLLYHDESRPIENRRQPPQRTPLRQARIISQAIATSKHRALKAIMQEVGMSSFEWYAAEYDSDNAPINLRPIVLGLLWLFSRSWRQRMRARASPIVAVRASRCALPLSAVQKAIMEAVKSKRFEIPDTTESFLISRKEKIVAMLGGPKDGVVVRIPFSPWALNSCRQNMRALRLLEFTPRINQLVPRPLQESDGNAQYFSVESLARGVPLRFYPQRADSLALVEDFLHMMNPSRSLETLTLRGAEFEKRVEKPLEELLALVPNDPSSSVVRNFLHGLLLGMTVPIGLTHGDLSTSNLYIKGDELASVIDWDEGSIRGIPALDPICHLISRQYRREPGFCSALAKLATAQWPVREELQFLHRCYQYYGVEGKLHFNFVMLHWLRAVSKQIDLLDAKTSSFVDRHIRAVVKFIAQCAKDPRVSDSQIRNQIC